MTRLLDWVGAHEAALAWLSIASAAMFVGSLLAVPWLIVRIPTDYFLHPHHYVDRWLPRHPLLRIAFLAIKNLVGVVLVLAGVAMLVLPGQGILTIVVGLLFLDFPGKRAMELRLVRLPPVLRAINWIRAKSARSPLELPKTPSTDREGANRQ
jgi:hypothetical protein